MTGARRFRKNEILVVVMTSLSTSEKSRNFWNGFSEIVVKPITKAKCLKIAKAVKLGQADHYFNDRLLRTI